MSDDPRPRVTKDSGVRGNTDGKPANKRDLRVYLTQTPDDELPRRSMQLSRAGSTLVPGTGLEPVPSCKEGGLSPPRLPFRHPGQCGSHTRPHECERAWPRSRVPPTGLSGADRLRVRRDRLLR